MKVAYIKDHSEACIPTGGIRRHGQFSCCQTKEFFFQFDYQFYLIKYNSCYEHYSHHLEMKEFILKQMSDGKRQKFEVTYSHKINDRFFRNIKDEVLRQDSVTEVISTYQNNAGTTYCFIKHHSFVDFCLLSADYKKNIEKAHTYLLDDMPDSAQHFRELEELVRCNERPASDVEIITVTDLITKSILKKCKQTKTY